MKKIDFTDGWFYCFDTMPVSQVYMAETYFMLYEKAMDVMPITAQQEQIMLTQMNYTNAIASLLQKESEYTFDDAVAYVSKLKTKDGYKKMEMAKNDFFSNSLNGLLPAIQTLNRLSQIIKLLPETEQELLRQTIRDTIYKQLNK